jgi:hypothetical protein
MNFCKINVSSFIKKLNKPLQPEESRLLRQLSETACDSNVYKNIEKEIWKHYYLYRLVIVDTLV